MDRERTPRAGNGGVAGESVIWPGAEGVEVEPREVPPPGPGELKVRVEASGLCGTDLHIASGEYPFARPGVTLGHEFSGTVVEAGPNDVGAFGAGDRIVADPNIPCRVCRYCHESRPHLCENPQALGVTLDGGLSEFALLPAAQAYRVPPRTSLRRPPRSRNPWPARCTRSTLGVSVRESGRWSSGAGR